MALFRLFSFFSVGALLYLNMQTSLIALTLLYLNMQTSLIALTLLYLNMQTSLIALTLASLTSSTPSMVRTPGAGSVMAFSKYGKLRS